MRESDPGPARHLAHLLAEARRQGEDFDSAWADCLEFVLSCVPPRNKEGNVRAEWQTALSWARPAFRKGWDRQHVTRLDPSMLAELDPD